MHLHHQTFYSSLEYVYLVLKLMDIIQCLLKLITVSYITLNKSQDSVLYSTK